MWTPRPSYQISRRIQKGQETKAPSRSTRTNRRRSPWETRKNAGRLEETHCFHKSRDRQEPVLPQQWLELAYDRYKSYEVNERQAALQNEPGEPVAAVSANELLDYIHGTVARTAHSLQPSILRHEGTGLSRIVFRYVKVSLSLGKDAPVSRPTNSEGKDRRKSRKLVAIPSVSRRCSPKNSSRTDF